MREDHLGVATGPQLVDPQHGTKKQKAIIPLGAGHRTDMGLPERTIAARTTHDGSYGATPDCRASPGGRPVAHQPSERMQHALIHDALPPPDVTGPGPGHWECAQPAKLLLACAAGRLGLACTMSPSRLRICRSGWPAGRGCLAPGSRWPRSRIRRGRQAGPSRNRRLFVWVLGDQRRGAVANRAERAVGVAEGRVPVVGCRPVRGGDPPPTVAGLSSLHNRTRSGTHLP